MAKHRVKQNGIFYCIPDDELYSLYRNREAFIDKYGRLINSKTKRVIKELEQSADDRPIYVLPPQEDHPIRDAVVSKVTDVVVDTIVYDVMPKIWSYILEPKIKRIYHSVISGKKTKAETIIEKERPAKRVSTAQLVRKTETEKQEKSKMTEEEIIAVQKSAITHYIGLLEDLRTLHDAGVIDDVSKTLEQLTNPATIEQFNQALSSNPNLLEMKQHIKVTTLLGRDLFQNGIYVPLQQEEIKLLVK